MKLVLDGESLTAREVAAFAFEPTARVEIAASAEARVRAGEREIAKIVAAYRSDFEAFRDGDTSRRPVQHYGITTGFGEFKDIPVAPDDLEALQRNLLLSHSVGIGESSDADDFGNYFPPEVVRATLLIRINTFLKGHSGVRWQMVETVVAMLHRGIVPLVPTRGSLGSSGDLCPLSHLFAVLLGEGTYYRVETAEDLGRRPRELRSAASSLAADLAMEPSLPSYKEGLALSNGATFSTAILALAVAAAEDAATTADVAASLSLEALCGCAQAFDSKIHRARGQEGQMTSAANIRLLLSESTVIDSAGAVQDPYSVRCAPVVHGASRDATTYVRSVVERELNAATDNPLFFFSEDTGAQRPWDHEFEANWPEGYDGSRRASYSAGNFHGQPIALAADFLAIALAELANISERRIQLLLDRNHNRNLPANLVARRGVNSGYMIAQYSAASLVAENKVLAHPASVDSIPSAANTEDHVAMAMTAATKLAQILANVQAVLAVELVVACQAIDWRVGMRYGPPPVEGRPGGGLGPRTPVAGAAGWDEVDAEADRFGVVTSTEHRESIAARLGRGSRRAYLIVRRLVEPLLADRPLSDEIRRVRRAVEDGALVSAVE